MVPGSKTENKSTKSLSLKERQRQEREVLILHAAYEVLVEKGYYEASMDEIATRVGISKGTLYLHFSSKEDLVFTLIQQEIVKFVALIDEVIHEDSSVRVRLEHILLETYRSMQSGRQFLVALRSIGLNQGVIRERLEEQITVAGLIDRLAMLFEEGKQRGEFNVHVPTQIMISLFLSLIQLYDNEHLLTMQALSPEELFKSASIVFFEGLSHSSSDM